MATLTWRDVAPPSFGGVQQGIQNAAQLFSNAGAAFNTGLEQFQKAQADQAGTSAILNAIREQNPNGYAAMMQGVDPTALNQAAVENILKSQGTMATADRARAATALDKQVTTDKMTAAGRLARDNAAKDAARVPNVLMADQFFRGNPEAAQQLYQQFAPVLAQLPVEEQQKMMQGLTTFGTGQQALGEKTQAATRADKTAALQAQSYMGDLTPEQSMARVSAYAASPGADPAVVNALIKNLNITPEAFTMPAPAGRAATSGKGTAPGASASTALSGGVTGATGSDSPYNTVVGNGMFGTTPKPLSEMTIGETVDFGKSTLIPATRNNAQLGLAGTGKGTSAMGAYQITGETLQEYGPKVFGKDWASTKMTPENQDKLAEALFNDRKGGNLKATWAALDNAEPGYYKDASWKDMRGLISQKETGRSVNELSAPGSQPALSAADQRFQTELQGDQLDRVVSQNRASGLTARLLELRKGPDLPVAEVVASLQEKGSVYAGMRPDDVATELRAVMQETGENAAVAAEVMKRNYSGNPSSLLVRTLGNFNPFNREGARITDMAGVARDVKGLQTGTADLRVAENKLAERDAKELAKAQKAADDAEAALTQARQQVQSRPAAAGQLATFERKAFDARQNLIAAQQKADDRISDARGSDRGNIPAQAAAQAANALVADYRNELSAAQTKLDEYLAKNEGKAVGNDSSYMRLRAEVLRANRKLQNARIEARK